MKCSTIYNSFKVYSYRYYLCSTDSSSSYRLNSLFINRSFKDLGVPPSQNFGNHYEDHIVYRRGHTRVDFDPTRAPYSSGGIFPNGIFLRAQYTCIAVLLRLFGQLLYTFFIHKHQNTRLLHAIRALHIYMCCIITRISGKNLYFLKVTTVFLLVKNLKCWSRYTRFVYAKRARVRTRVCTIRLH